MTVVDDDRTTGAARSLVAGGLVLGALSIGVIGVRTSASLDVPAALHRFGGATNTGVPVDVVTVAPLDTAARLRDLRSSAGLSWNQVAALFGVSRRSVHAWVAGSVMRTANRERLDTLLGIAERPHDGSAQRRAALFDHARGSAPAVRPEVLLERGGWVDVPHVLDEAPMPLG